MCSGGDAAFTLVGRDVSRTGGNTGDNGDHIRVFIQVIPESNQRLKIIRSHRIAMDMLQSDFFMFSLLDIQNEQMSVSRFISGPHVAISLLFHCFYVHFPEIPQYYANIQYWFSADSMNRCTSYMLNILNIVSPYLQNKLFCM